MKSILHIHLKNNTGDERFARLLYYTKLTNSTKYK